MIIDDLKLKYNIEIPPKDNMGDFAIPLFEIAKKTDKKTNELYNDIKNELLKYEIIKDTSFLNGFLNIVLDKKLFANDVIKSILSDNYFDKFKKNSGNIMIEYVSPNLNKSLSIGHFRNFCIGKCICNLYEFIGFKVIPTILFNDRGIHICKAMLAYQKWGENQNPQDQNEKSDSFVSKYYVLFDEMNKKEANQKNISENETDLSKESAQMLQKWENKDPEILNLWRKITKWALDGINQTLNEFKANFKQIYFESDFWDKGKEMVLDALNKGICYKTEDGAIEIDLSDVKLDKKILLRKDNTTLYITQDLYITAKKFKDFDLLKSIWVVAREQEYHFKVLFEICKRFGIANTEKFYHLSYGMVTLKGKKMSSRTGLKANWDDVYNEVTNMIKNITPKDKYTDINEWEKTCKTLAKSAMIFYILLSSTNKDIDYNPEESISIHGKTGPYILYTLVRIKSILNKIPKNNINLQEKSIQKNIDNISFKLIRHLYLFEETIEKSYIQYSPHIICNYTFDLCEYFNKFYETNKIIENNNINQDNYLITLTTLKILKKCLDILGIEEIDKI